MEVKKNWFTYIALVLFSAGVAFALVNGIWTFGANHAYPFLARGGLVLAMAGVWLALQLVLLALARLKPFWLRFFSNTAPAVAVQAVLVAGILVCAALARLYIIWHYPMQPASDFLTYYQVATFLSEGSLVEKGVGYCDYIALFPHVIGYPYLLSLLFRLTGPSVTAGLYLGVAASLLSCLLVYAIVRKLCGRLAALAALVLVAFWPSQILFSNMLAAEPVFTCLLLACLLLAVHLFRDWDALARRPALGVALHAVLGAGLALTSSVRPMAILLLVGILICLLPARVRLAQPGNATPLLQRFLARGWRRAVVVLLSFLLVSSVVGSATSAAVQRTLPGTLDSFGYNLLVGLQAESKGTWNAEDSALLSETYAKTGSAAQAHRAARQVALERIKADPTGILNLMVEKYALLWQQDEYGAYWNLNFLAQQGNLTPARETFLRNSIPPGNAYYLFCLLLAGFMGLRLWRKQDALLQIPMLVFLGTAALHLVVEMQNRYFYHVLPMLAILAAGYIAEVYGEFCAATQQAPAPDAVPQQAALPVAAAAEPAQPLPAPAFRGFDMWRALEDGHITISASAAYFSLKPAAEKSKQPADSTAG